MPDVVITNTSPIFYLHRLGLLWVLEKLYKKIVVPQAVILELEEGKLQGEDIPNLAEYPWILTQQVKSAQHLKLVADLGPGESEVLALALQNPNSLVILDEKIARSIAELAGLNFTGTIGVILKAKNQGYISSVTEVIEQLFSIGFRISDKMKEHILILSGESPSCAYLNR
ncbi:MAG: hypothetical protein AUJ85_09025 [Elusimicrobia bacterium CG1_02_37_114]|nr:MAG: hypothetical protein AUJ85_09025 [Elusimicrobia bacterium CG1_02_37_114]PIV53529.1 MAG: DUF3368 domain-containing protein [Elusimicrobia bacterium CG02_land_8_20_14_3_00_37_13]PIZ12704.1 MAG: DUF3368 domain-containing protein [Elusimicrobia bacterium CG_4_10_14_0_8_um_filter_37_32]